MLRDTLGLTGTKYGCGIAQRGACTVHVDGMAMRSCVAPVGDYEGSEITTKGGVSGKAAEAVRMVDGVRRAIAAAGATILYLPAYSPDLSPIEQLFAKKALLREAARTKDQLWSTIGRLLDAWPATECANYLRHCGEVPPKVKSL